MPFTQKIQNVLATIEQKKKQVAIQIQEPQSQAKFIQRRRNGTQFSQTDLAKMHVKLDEIQEREQAFKIFKKIIKKKKKDNNQDPIDEKSYDDGKNSQTGDKNQGKKKKSHKKHKQTNDQDKEEIQQEEQENEENKQQETQKSITNTQFSDPLSEDLPSGLKKPNRHKSLNEDLKLKGMSESLYQDTKKKKKKQKKKNSILITTQKNRIGNQLVFLSDTDCLEQMLKRMVKEKQLKVDEQLINWAEEIQIEAHEMLKEQLKQELNLCDVEELFPQQSSQESISKNSEMFNQIEEEDESENENENEREESNMNNDLNNKLGRFKIN